MTDHFTDALVDFAHGLQFKDLGADVLHAAKRCLLDGVAVSIAGLEQEIAPLLRDHLRSQGGAPDARLIGSPYTSLPATAAATYAGAIGNALDWDDVQLPEGLGRPFGLLMHATVPLMAAGLAAAELRASETGSAVSGAEFLTAFVAGWEVAGKIAVAINPDHYLKGFHTSGTLGTFGAAVMVSKLLGLSREQMAQAVGAAASMTGGIRASLGTMVKPLHVGWAAAKGIEAALLVRAGITGPAQALDGQWGYLAVAGRGADLDLVRGRIGAPFVLVDPGISYKPYPCGAVTHPGMDAMATVMREHALTADDIAAVTVAAGNNVWGPITYPFATTPLEGKYSFPFLLSAIILRGKAGRAEFAPAFITSPECVALQKRITTVFDAEIDARGYASVHTRLDITLTDGRVITQWADENYRGGPKVQLTDAELEAKFDDCAAGLIAPYHVMQVKRFIWDLEEAETIGDLFDLIGHVA